MTLIQSACLAGGILAAAFSTPLAIGQDEEYTFGPEPRFTLSNSAPVPASSWSNRGFQTSADAVQTVFWTVRRAGYLATLPYMPETERAEFERHLRNGPPFDDPYKEALSQVESCQLLAWGHIDDPTVELIYLMKHVKGHAFKLSVILRTVDGEWKFLGFEVSSSNTCLNNLRQLVGAIDQFAIEHDVSDDYRPTRSDVLPYLMRAPLCPDFGRYTLGTVKAPVTCSIHGTMDASRPQSNRP